jgi:hypothetical protein
MMLWPKVVVWSLLSCLKFTRSFERWQRGSLWKFRVLGSSH